MKQRLWLGLILLSMVFGAARPAFARGVNARFLLDAAPGLAVPIAADGWRDYTGPSFKFSARVGAELWFSRHFALAGEVDLDPEALITDDGVRGRVRALVGLRLLIGFGVGAFFIRQAIGVDYLASLRRGGSGETGLGLEPGFGLQFRFIRHGVVGFALDFPTGIFDFRPNVDPYLAADVQFLGFIGVRI